MSALEIDDVVVTHRRRGAPPVHAVKGVSLTVERGQIVGLVGESGCGKSSLARVAVGIDRPTSGAVRFDGEPLHPLTMRRRPSRDRGLQMVFQNPYASLSPRRSIGAQLLDGAPDALERSARAAEVSRLLRLVGLDESAASRYPTQFSGGQRQRLAIARALAAQPSVVVADEPVTALDAFSSAQIVELLQGLVRELGMAMLFISHDLSLVRAIADETAVMYAGEIIERGPSEQLWQHAQHPYTQRLIDAIPEIGPTKRLPGREEDLAEAVAAPATGGEA
ncbi:ABC transporter ATP-binding protein [Microbacterium sp. ISL-59]|uniref:ABC transporter ATP-binding protein n=1 Tax=Microbacterium sp. ISL-59 TaxID=2819159 RepID=UPI001BE50470|nr:ABC transporter ATP-binding protein [Microbacterium sp. ISL-59]MBT2497041.1 ABC transporter ATP-binding protein [Microbacterium sp. ISL-59]